MRTHLLAISAFVFCCGTASAQGSGKSAAVRVNCPASIDLRYTQVGKLDFGDPSDQKLSIEGWQPGFTATSVRLVSAGMAFPPDEKRAVMGIPPDNTEAKPNEPLQYGIAPADPKAPSQPIYPTCEYEGGFMLQKPIPPAVQSCALHTRSRKAESSETSTRAFLTTAEFVCR